MGDSAATPVTALGGALINMRAAVGEARFPLAVASAVERLSDRTVLEIGTAGTLAVLVCFLAIRTPGVGTRHCG